MTKALDTIATGLLSAALSSVTRPKLMVRPSRTTRASASPSEEASAFRKCVVWSTVVIGRKPRLAALMAITIAVSASAISAWPQTMPPFRHSRSENAIRKIAPGCQSGPAAGGREVSSRSIDRPRSCTHGANTSPSTRLASSTSNSAAACPDTPVLPALDLNFIGSVWPMRSARETWLENAAIGSIRLVEYRWAGHGQAFVTCVRRVRPVYPARWLHQMRSDLGRLAANAESLQVGPLSGLMA